MLLLFKFHFLIVHCLYYRNAIDFCILILYTAILPKSLTSLQSLGVPKTTLMFDNSLGESTELTESWYTHGYDFLQQKDTD